MTDARLAMVVLLLGLAAVLIALTDFQPQNAAGQTGLLVGIAANNNPAYQTGSAFNPVEFTGQLFQPVLNPPKFDRPIDKKPPISSNQTQEHAQFWLLPLHTFEFLMPQQPPPNNLPSQSNNDAASNVQPSQNPSAPNPVLTGEPASQIGLASSGSQSQINPAATSPPTTQSGQTNGNTGSEQQNQSQQTQPPAQNQTGNANETQPPSFDQTFPQPSSTQGEPVERWWSEIVRICHDKWRLDPYFIAAIVKHESWFDERAENQAEKQAYEMNWTTWFGPYYGKGLMQPTGPWIAGVPYPQEQDWEYNMPPEANRSAAPRMDDALNGTQNLDRGCWYFDIMMQHYNRNYLLAAAAYHYGWFGVDGGGDNENSSYVVETRQYYEAYLRTVNRTPAIR